MPKLLPVRNFAKAGLNTDLLPWDLPADFLTEMRNVRISGEKLTPFGGSQKWADLPDGFAPGFIMHVGSLSGTFWMIPGLDAVYVYDGATFSDVSNSAGYAGITDESLWQGCMLSAIPIINNPNHYPEYWPNPNGATLLEYLPWDATQTWEDVGESARIIRSHKQYLFALDLQSGAQEIEDGVRWSAPADIGGLPPTWDPLDTTNFAGLTNLGGDGGRIIDGLSMRDAFVVYRENSISVFDYVGGNFVWRIRHLSTTVGLIAPDCIVEVKGKHFFIGDGDILVNDGNTITSLLHNRIRKRFVSNYDPDNFLNSFAIKNNVVSEVWFCVPTIGSVFPNVAYIYNWRDDTWAIRDIPSTPMANYGPQNSPPITWDSISDEWDAASSLWDQRQLTPMDDTIIAITQAEAPATAGTLLLLDKLTDGVDTPFSSIIERIGYPLEGLNKVTTITRIYPRMSGPGQVWAQVGSQDYAGAPVRWKTAIPFIPELDRKIDIRTTGELHCFRFFSDDGSAFWEISGMDVEYVEAGRR